MARVDVHHETGSIHSIFDGAKIASAIIMHNDSSVSDNNANRDNGHEMPSVRKWYRSFYYLPLRQTSIFLLAHRVDVRSVKAHESFSRKRKGDTCSK